MRTADQLPRPLTMGLLAVLRRVVAYFLLGTGTPEPGGLGRLSVAQTRRPVPLGQHPLPL